MMIVLRQTPAFVPAYVSPDGGRPRPMRGASAIRTLFDNCMPAAAAVPAAPEAAPVRWPRVTSALPPVERYNYEHRLFADEARPMPARLAAGMVLVCHYAQSHVARDWLLAFEPLAGTVVCANGAPEREALQALTLLLLCMLSHPEAHGAALLELATRESACRASVQLAVFRVHMRRIACVLHYFLVDRVAAAPLEPLLDTAYRRIQEPPAALPCQLALADCYTDSALCDTDVVDALSAIDALRPSAHIVRRVFAIALRLMGVLHADVLDAQADSSECARALSYLRVRRDSMRASAERSCMASRQTVSPVASERMD